MTVSERVHCVPADLVSAFNVCRVKTFKGDAHEIDIGWPSYVRSISLNQQSSFINRAPSRVNRGRSVCSTGSQDEHLAMDCLTQVPAAPWRRPGVPRHELMVLLMINKAPRSHTVIPTDTSGFNQPGF